MAKPQIVSPEDENDPYVGAVRTVASPDDEIVAPPNVLTADHLTTGSAAWRIAMVREGRQDEMEAYYGPNTVVPNDELQSEIETQRAFDSEPDRPMQPYVRTSSAYKAEQTAKLAQLDNTISVLEAQRNGLNARIDDENQTREAVKAALAVLK